MNNTHEEDTMKTKSRWVFLFVFLLLVGIWACATAVTVQLRDKEGSGKYLTDEMGMTLYYYKNDLDGQSSCIDNCVQRWPIFFREKIIAPDGMNANDFSTITRIDGPEQTAYRGHPLYYWYDDKQPGDMKGEGINKTWYVIYYPDKFKP
jgi:predicted lipoprotein with Yx(FWY)xxD motif